MSGGRSAVLADVHGNFCALEAVLAHAGRQGVEDVLFLGDAVGYGPEPQRCVERLRAEVKPETWVLGNHDEGLGFLIGCGARREASRGRLLRDRIGFSRDTLRALKLNARLLRLYPDRISHLVSRPTMVHLGGRLLLVHGALRHGKPTTTATWNRWDARDELEALARRPSSPEAPILLFGHTHVPACYGSTQGPSGPVAGVVPLAPGRPVGLDGGSWLLNPGSVGQPRDGDWRASYLVVDESRSTAQLHRVEYDLRTTQDRMASLGLPVNLATRLAAGR